MFETGAIVTGLSTLVWNTISETAKAEGGSSLGRLLNKDIGAALRQQIHHASNAYLKNYQERHGKLKVACVRMDTPMELDKLYTAVRVLERSELTYFESVEGLLSQYRESGKRGFQRAASGKQGGIDIANQEQFLMVLGGPGIGKSTLLRKVGLEALKSKEGTYSHSCIPVFLPLQRFKDVDTSIEQRIAKEFETCGFPEPAAVTAAMLKKGKLLVLLDGLDEVAKDVEDAVVDQIRDFVDAHSNNRFIASCRVAAYKGGFPRFKDVAIAPFEDEQIKEFVQSWFSSEKDLENDTAEKCWKLMDRPEYAATKELAQTPLLLTLLCAVYNKQQAFPKNRASLYGEALDIVLKEWAAEKRIHNNPIYLDLTLELERELLAELAFNSFVNEQLFFDKRDVTDQIKEFLVGNLNAPKHLNSEAVLHAIEVQQGILTERARDAYSFSHLTFQEYLTAQHIVDTQQVEWLVDKYLTNRQWQEVFLLVAGLLRGKGADVLLKTMETKAVRFLQEQKLRAFIEWVESSTANSGCSGVPAAKRAGAVLIVLSIGLAPMMTITPSLRFIDDDNSGLGVILDLVSTLSLLLPIRYSFKQHTVDKDFRTLAQEIQNRQVFNRFSYNKLIDDLDQSTDETMSLDQALQSVLAVWSSALQLDVKKILSISGDEQDTLTSYFYSCDLLVQCKDAAVRVSPAVWQGIEERLLTVPKDAEP